MPTGLPCFTTADCFPLTTCVNGLCDKGNGFGCRYDEDCPAAGDVCCSMFGALGGGAASYCDFECNSE